jgi:hypothetical protein
MPGPSIAIPRSQSMCAPAMHQAAGSELLIPVRVTNTSDHDWRQRDCGSLQVGNHWFDETGRYMVVQDDGRTPLPQIVSSGQSCDVVLSVTVPSTPGQYQGEIYVVHEGVTWFRDRGSVTFRVDVVVTAAASAESTPANTINELPIPEYPAEITAPAGGGNDTEDIEPFPMHCVKRAQVLEIIAQHGGTLVHIEDGLRAGVEWVDYRYFVRNR